MRNVALLWGALNACLLIIPPEGEREGDVHGQDSSCGQPNEPKSLSLICAECVQSFDDGTQQVLCL